MDILLSKKMKYFMVTMERRNFSLADDELCITRSPLSKVITEIENRLGGGGDYLSDTTTIWNQPR